MNHISITFRFLICLIACGAANAAESDSHRVGVGATYGYNFDGGMYEDSQSLQLLYLYNRVQVNLGAKHYQFEGRSEYISDLSILYSVHDGDVFDLKIGLGLEDKYPTVEYVAEYALSKYLGASIALNQTLNDDFGQNQREAVFGLAYYFYDNRSEPELEDIELRSSSLDIDEKPQCSTNLEEGQCTPDVEPEALTEEKPKAKVDAKPSLPYVVQEGDWLYKLRRKFGFDLAEIIERNGIDNPDLIYPGQVLE